MPTTVPSQSPLAVVQRQVEAYNARDLAKFLAEYADDITVYRPPAAAPTLVGKEAFGRFYASERFCHSGLRAEIMKRMVIGSTVIDHERITGVSATPFEVAIVYEVRDGLIRRTWTHAVA